MGQFIQALALTMTAVILLWFGYTLFIRVGFHASQGNSMPYPGYRKQRKWFKSVKKQKYGMPGDPRTCPVCCSRLEEGLLVKSLAFPSLNGGKDRLMYIKGCVFCLRGERDRICPVCGHVLGNDEVLVCRMFERPFAFRQRPHVHVLGCSRCRGG